MEFRVIKPFSSVRWGNKVKGDPIELNKDTAKQMIDAGMVELTEEAAAQIRVQRAEAEARKKSKK